jgi:hypothetical protein
MNLFRKMRKVGADGTAAGDTKRSKLIRRLNDSYAALEDIRLLWSGIHVRCETFVEVPKREGQFTSKTRPSSCASHTPVLPGREGPFPAKPTGSGRPTAGSDLASVTRAASCIMLALDRMRDAGASIVSH